jgi:hypothetical protein
MEEYQEIEYKWFSLIKGNEEFFDDSQVIHLKNPFQSEELNNFLPYYLNQEVKVEKPESRDLAADYFKQ